MFRIIKLIFILGKDNQSKKRFNCLLEKTISRPFALSVITNQPQSDLLSPTIEQSEQHMVPQSKETAEEQSH